MIDLPKDNIIVAIISLVGGYFIHVFKSKFDNKQKIKSINRLFKADIDKILEFSKKYCESDVYGVVTDRLTLFENWNNEFYKISPSLNDVQSSLLIDIYRTVDEITNIQNQGKKYQDEIKQKYPKMRGPVDFGDGVMSSLSRQFDQLIKHLNDTDYDELLSIIETNSV